MQKHMQKLKTRLSSLLQRIDHGAHAMLTSIHRPRHDNDIPPTSTGHIAATTPVAGPATLNSVSQHIYQSAYHTVVNQQDPNIYTEITD